MFWLKYQYSLVGITKTCLFKYTRTENFSTKKLKFSDKNSDIFHISVQNIGCGYSLEPPRQSMFLGRYKKNNIGSSNASLTHPTPQILFAANHSKAASLLQFVFACMPVIATQCVLVYCHC